MYLEEEKNMSQWRQEIIKFCHESTPEKRKRKLPSENINRKRRKSHYKLVNLDEDIHSLENLFENDNSNGKNCLIYLNLKKFTFLQQD